VSGFGDGSHRRIDLVLLVDVQSHPWIFSIALSSSRSLSADKQYPLEALVMQEATERGGGDADKAIFIFDMVMNNEIQQNQDRKRNVAAAGGVIGAVLASSCCIDR